MTAQLAERPTGSGPSTPPEMTTPKSVRTVRRDGGNKTGLRHVVPSEGERGGKNPGLSTGGANPDCETPSTAHVRASTPDEARTARTPAPIYGARACRRCAAVKMPEAFPLLRETKAVSRGWATRYWCVDCLVDRGHLPATARRRSRYADDPVEVEPDMRAPLPGDRALAHARVERHQLVAELVDSLLGVPDLVQRVFARPDAVDVLVDAMRALAVTQEAQ